jgi:hypothetical protein
MRFGFQQGGRPQDVATRHGAGLTYFIAIFAGRAGRRPASELRKVSCISLFFCKYETPAARGRTRGSRNEKPGAACRPGFWRSFGEYLFLEDSRYTSKRKIELR